MDGENKAITTKKKKKNKPVHEIMVPIAYASSEGSDEPAHPRKIASALTAHIHIEGMLMKVHALILSNIASLSGNSKAL